jgi:hypothetical protein
LRWLPAHSDCSPSANSHSTYCPQAQSKAEHYETLQHRLAALLPDLRRLYKNGELMPNGEPSGVHIKLIMNGDMPFIRHVCGLLSHNANSFGTPFCDCTDGDLYNFTFDKAGHYGQQLSFETLCHRAHVPLWQAFDEVEPAEWSFTCDCCKKVC